MAETDRPEDDSIPSAEDVAVEENADQEEPQEVSLSLDVKIDERTACERHLTVSISREDIERSSAKGMRICCYLLNIFI